jgi:voltage-gated potassium channel
VFSARADRGRFLKTNRATQQREMKTCHAWVWRRASTQNLRPLRIKAQIKPHGGASAEAAGYLSDESRVDPSEIVFYCPLMANDSAKKLTAFQLLMLVLSVYVLVALFVDTVFKLPAEIVSLLEILDTAICFIFLGDFFYRLYRAESRLAFLKWGWIDFVSSIPMFDVFRWGRIVRVVRILRILRGIRSAKFILTILFENRVKGTFSVVMLVSFVLLIFSSVAILNAETTPDANIKTAGDALWWALSTITTVGYGDRFPVTAEGRIVGSFLMLAGVGFFGTLTASIASFFLGANKESETELARELRLLRERLDVLEKNLSKTPVSLPAQFGSPPVT